MLMKWEVSVGSYYQMDVTKHIFTLQYSWHRDPRMLLDTPLDYSSAVVKAYY